MDRKRTKKNENSKFLLRNKFGTDIQEHIRDYAEGINANVLFSVPPRCISDEEMKRIQPLNSNNDCPRPFNYSTNTKCCEFQRSRLGYYLFKIEPGDLNPKLVYDILLHDSPYFRLHDDENIFFHGVNIPEYEFLMYQIGYRFAKHEKYKHFFKYFVYFLKTRDSNLKTLLTFIKAIFKKVDISSKSMISIFSLFRNDINLSMTFDERKSIFYIIFSSLLENDIIERNNVITDRMVYKYILKYKLFDFEIKYYEEIYQDVDRIKRKQPLINLLFDNCKEPDVIVSKFLELNFGHDTSDKQRCFMHTIWLWLERGSFDDDDDNEIIKKIVIAVLKSRNNIGLDDVSLFDWFSDNGSDLEVSDKTISRFFDIIFYDYIDSVSHFSRSFESILNAFKNDDVNLFISINEKKVMLVYIFLLLVTRRKLFNSFNKFTSYMIENGDIFDIKIIEEVVDKKYGGVFELMKRIPRSRILDYKKIFPFFLKYLVKYPCDLIYSLLEFYFDNVDNKYLESKFLIISVYEWSQGLTQDQKNEVTNILYVSMLDNFIRVNDKYQWRSAYIEYFQSDMLKEVDFKNILVIESTQKFLEYYNEKMNTLSEEDQFYYAKDLVEYCTSNFPGS